jgi:UDP-N-acetylmuramoyl-tripeptide--D-alanyl-D-alanine ligase
MQSNLRNNALDPTEAALWSDGNWTATPPAPLNGVFSDTRAAAPGALFIAIKGENFDGHEFVEKAFDCGAAAAMVDEDNPLPSSRPARPLLRVKNTRDALRSLAAGYRAKINPRVIGITGSAGKTTTKEWTAALLSTAFKTAKTPGNLNNDLGLPFSLLAMPADAEIGVFEAGTNHPGEIAPLAALMRPTVAILTNIAPVHIGNFGSEQAIADEKAALLRALPPDGAAILDAASPYFACLAAQASCRVIAVGETPSCDYSASEIDAATGEFSVHEKSSHETHRIRTGQSGTHNVTNALMAIAAARHFGVPWQSMDPAFADMPALDKRWQRIEKDGVHWINDAYNANPLSMEKALERFALEPCAARRIAVLGDMFELGDYAETGHRRTGSAAARAGLDLLLTVGEMSSRWLAASAVEAGMSAEKIERMETAIAAKTFLKQNLRAGDLILLKASRGMRLEALLS